jgi:misacylated tRNA(Ala) deacylase
VGRSVTERLWLTQPRKATCLAKVVAARGEWVSLDRTVLAPTSRSHRHPQPHDQGTLWWRGEKRRVDRTDERDGVLWHRVPGAKLEAGAEVNLHLDPERRLLASRAHTALHLLLPGLAAAGAKLVADPEVKNGGNIRLELAAPLSAPALAAALKQANDWVAANVSITREHTSRDALHDATAQPFHPPDPVPGPDPLELVRIPGLCCYPCDGTHVERTGLVGRIVVTEARPSKGRFTLVARVRAA